MLVRIAKNETCPSPYLRWAAGHDEEKVQLAVAMNPSAPDEAIAKLRSSKFEKVLSSLPVDYQLAGEPEEVFRVEVRSYLGRLSVEESTKAWEKKDLGLAQFKHLSVESRLELIGWTPYNDVSEKIAKNPNTPASALESLAKYKDEWVLLKGVAKHPNTPVVLLKELA